MSVCVWLDKCSRCHGERDKRTMLYKSRKTNAAAEYRSLERRVNESKFIKLQSTPLHSRVCLPCLWDLVGWLDYKAA